MQLTDLEIINRLIDYPPEALYHMGLINWGACLGILTHERQHPEDNWRILHWT